MNGPRGQALITIWKYGEAPAWARQLYEGVVVPAWVMQIPAELVESIDVLLETSSSIALKTQKYLVGDGSVIYIGTQVAPDTTLVAAQRQSVRGAESVNQNTRQL